MNKGAFEIGHVWNELLKLITIIVIYVFSKKLWYPDNSIWEAIRDNVIIIVTSIAYFIIYNVAKIIQKPIKIKVNLKHSISSKESHEIWHDKSHSMREDAKMVSISIMILQTNTVWNSLALKIFNNRNIDLLIEISPKDGMLYCQCEAQSDDILYDNDSFRISLNNLIYSNLDNNIPMVKKYNFMIDENRDKLFQHSQEFIIKPKLLIDSKSMNYIHSIFIRLINDMEKGYYTIYHYK